MAATTTKVTITEALAEIKTLSKRRDKKKEGIRQFLFRQELNKDPLQKEGGSATFVAEERQALHDLEERVVSIRRAIRQSNEETTITIDNESRSIADWLAWRREVSQDQQAFLADIRNRINGVRQQAVTKGMRVVAEEKDATGPGDVIVNLNEKELVAQVEHIEKVLGDLDGQLSLKNATVIVEY